MHKIADQGHDVGLEGIGHRHDMPDIGQRHKRAMVHVGQERNGRPLKRWRKVGQGDRPPHHPAPLGLKKRVDQERPHSIPAQSYWRLSRTYVDPSQWLPSSKNVHPALWHLPELAPSHYPSTGHDEPGKLAVSRRRSARWLTVVGSSRYDRRSWPTRVNDHEPETRNRINANPSDQ